MRFMLFGGLVIVVYTALAYARRFSAGWGGVDEADLREAVLNPSATVAGVPARHAFVAGQLREEPQSLKVS